jgi:threonine dehydrogenase-like Zn-dependent dehydrogenase
MQAVCWHGKQDVRVNRVPDPAILDSEDAIVRITLSAICGSDLHLYNGQNPAMEAGDILGHEFMGIVEEVGKDVRKLRKGDRVVVPAIISCGRCFFCERHMWSLCDNSNPDAVKMAALYGYPAAGIYGYSHLYGGFAGGQAQYVRVPFADYGPLKLSTDLPDEKVLFLSDILPTGYMAAENCNIQRGDTVAVWGCGPVGQFAIQSARLLGAEKVIAIDSVESRLKMAREKGGAETIDYEQERDVVERLKEMTGGRGPDSCIDAVGMEAHGMSVDGRPQVLRQTIQACRKGGTVSLPGVYSGFVEKFPIGVAFSKALTLKMGPTHVPKYMGQLLGYIERGEIDPSSVITKKVRLSEAPDAYRRFNRREADYVKVVLTPQ